MWILIPYIIAGIITARFLERNRFRVAVVVHSVMFVVLAFFIIIFQSQGYIYEFVEKIFGYDSIYNFKEMLSIGMHNGQSISSFIMLLQVITTICSLFGAAILATHVVDVIKKSKRNLFKTKREKANCVFNKELNYKAKDYCKIYCRLLC